MHCILRAATRSLGKVSSPPWTTLIAKRQLPRCACRPCPRLAPTSIRWSSATASPTPTSPTLPHRPAPHRDPNEPIYQLTFTCKVCKDRSSHTISKQGYHRGTVLINCPGCKNRHLISDHLKVSLLSDFPPVMPTKSPQIFADKSTTIEDIMRDQGEEVQRGSITPDGDVEFWAQDAEANAKG